MKLIDLTNKKFGRLLVLHKSSDNTSKQGTFWTCKCECGNITNVRSELLRRGIIKSCGCLLKEMNNNKLKDITGQKFGRLVVLERDFSKKGSPAYWICKCDCGNIKSVSGTHLRSGHIRSCGCLFKDAVREVGKNNKTHGLKHNPIYKLWGSIKQRCNNPNSPNYRMYGGRGIKMCEEWSKEPYKFYLWALENGYKKGLQIDRIDNYKGYSPENCRWVTCKENCNNKRNNAKIEKHICVNCGKTFDFKRFKITKDNRHIGVFCSQSCRYEFYRKCNKNPNTPYRELIKCKNI